MNITIRNKRGSWRKTTKYLSRDWALENMLTLHEYGAKGVAALSANTPKDTGLTAESWTYFIKETEKRVKIVWVNDNIKDDLSIALLIQYGHGTRNRGYVKGIDYINPAIRPIFDQMVSDIDKEIKS